MSVTDPTSHRVSSMAKSNKRLPLFPGLMYRFHFSNIFNSRCSVYFQCYMLYPTLPRVAGMSKHVCFDTCWTSKKRHAIGRSCLKFNQTLKAILLSGSKRTLESGYQEVIFQQPKLFYKNDGSISHVLLMAEPIRTQHWEFGTPHNTQPITRQPDTAVGAVEVN